MESFAAALMSARSWSSVSTWDGGLGDGRRPHTAKRLSRTSPSSWSHREPTDRGVLALALEARRRVTLIGKERVGMFSGDAGDDGGYPRRSQGFVQPSHALGVGLSRSRALVSASAAGTTAGVRGGSAPQRSLLPCRSWRWFPFPDWLGQ